MGRLHICDEVHEQWEQIKLRANRLGLEVVRRDAEVYSFYRKGDSAVCRAIQVESLRAVELFLKGYAFAKTEKQNEG